MRRSLKLENLKPQSINSMYYGTGHGYAKTSDAKAWAMEVFFQLDLPANKQALRDLREAFDSTKHAFSVTLRATYPHIDFQTQKGHISSRTQDLSNWEKPLIDCIFLPKFCDLPVPEGAANVCADDKYVVDLHSSKRAGTGYAIDVTIEIVDLASLSGPSVNSLSGAKIDSLSGAEKAPEETKT
jgi:hypothetical protein